MIANETKNGITCKCDRKLLRIAKILMGGMATFEIKEIIEKLQRASKELAQIMGVERVVIFKIYRKDHLSALICELVAGTPEGVHKIGFSNWLSGHPDIELAYNNKKVILINDPKTNPATEHFRPTIMHNDINQILYIPLVSASDKPYVRGVIVLDALRNREFSMEDCCCCECAGELISMTLNYMDAIELLLEDKTLNPAVAEAGIFGNILKHAAKIKELVEPFVDAAKKTEETFKERRRTRF